jgi:hypothetical protein
MNATIIAKSHLDHNIPTEVLKYLCSLDLEGEGVVVKTIDLPEDFPPVPCRLYGPLMGDEPVDESSVRWAPRGEREGDSRLIDEPPRMVRQVTMIVGPYEDEPHALYTAFAGPLAERELFEDASPKALAFWAEHALSA